MKDAPQQTGRFPNPLREKQYRLLGFGHHRWRHRAQIPYQAKPRHHREDVESDVDLPPFESLPGRVHVVMVVVMPTFTQRDKRQ